MDRKFTREQAIEVEQEKGAFLLEGGGGDGGGGGYLARQENSRLYTQYLMRTRTPKSKPFQYKVSAGNLLLSLNFGGLVIGREPGLPDSVLVSHSRGGEEEAGG